MCVSLLWKVKILAARNGRISARRPSGSETRALTHICRVAIRRPDATPREAAAKLPCSYSRGEAPPGVRDQARRVRARSAREAAVKLLTGPSHR